MSRRASPSNGESAFAPLIAGGRGAKPVNPGVTVPLTPPAAARVICSRCRVGEITVSSGVCPLCGYSPTTGQVVQDPIPAAFEEAVRRELGDQFKIERLLGRGGMSLVYLARELELNRMVAVKVLPIQLSMGPDALERFRREAKIGASLDHPHIVPVHRIGNTPTFLWYTMKWVKGCSLRDLLDKGAPMSLHDSLSVLEPVAGALHYGHRRGIVHRDIKPANILLDDTGWVGLCDFGIAKAFGATPLTNTGAALGTPGYMAPEQCYGKALDGRADQYSLAILAYECLTGHVPFTGDSLGEIVRKHCTEPPPRVTAPRADLPESLAEALDRALKKQPEERYDTVLDFVRALGGDPSRSGPISDEVLVALAPAPVTPQPGMPPRRVGKTWIALIAGAVALALLAGASLLTRGPSPTTSAPPPAAAVSPGPAPVEPGRLSVNSTPWGDCFVDGRHIGPTPVVDLELPPGRHRLQITRAGYETYEQDLEIASGDRIRLTAIVLKQVRRP
jgi:serine/threonine-protein kinase